MRRETQLWRGLRFREAVQVGRRCGEAVQQGTEKLVMCVSWSDGSRISIRECLRIHGRACAQSAVRDGGGRAQTRGYSG